MRKIGLGFMFSLVLMTNALGETVSSSKDTPQQETKSDVREIKFDSLEAFCAYDGNLILKDESIYGFPPDDEVSGILRQILENAVARGQSYELVASNVINAVAARIGEERLILYRQSFMDNLARESGTMWTVKAILAHEVGHHLLEHLLPKSNRLSRHQEELQADRFSGMVLRQMGATKEEALIAVNRVPSETDTDTHPSKSIRMVAVEAGWKRPDDIKKFKTSTTVLKAYKSKFSFKNPNLETPEIISRIFLKEDPEGEYYLDSDGVIIKVLAEGRLVLVGKKDSQVAAGYHFKYEIGAKKYDVDEGGGVWERFHNVPVKSGTVETKFVGHPAQAEQYIRFTNQETQWESVPFNK